MLSHLPLGLEFILRWVCDLYQKGRRNTRNTISWELQKLLLILQVLKISLSYKAGLYVIHIRLFLGNFSNKMTYLVVGEQWVMLSVGEENCLSTKPGKNTWSASAEVEICVSFSLHF